MFEQLMKELMEAVPKRQGLSTMDWARTKAAEFDAGDAFEEHIREKGAELLDLCREHGIPAMFTAITADNSDLTTSATIMGSGIAKGSDAHPMSRTSHHLLMAYAIMNSNDIEDMLNAISDVAAHYELKKKLGNL